MARERQLNLDGYGRAGSSSGRSAFSVIELMLAIAIMGVIIYALYSVFNQTQRALRSNETQSDVSERARAVMEMISRELEQAQPTFKAFYGLQEINMMGGAEYPPKVQPDPRDPQRRPDIQPRTNFLHNIFFYNRRTNAWQSIGYRVIHVTNGVGILQRFQTNLFGANPLTNRLSEMFVREPLTSTNYHHVADGVIHLSFIPYDRQGYRLGFDTPNCLGDYSIYRRTFDGNKLSVCPPGMSNMVPADANVLLAEGFRNPGFETWRYATAFSFRSNALPAYIDLELGILEPEALAQYYTMLKDQNAGATNFLARQISKVHLFRQRIPIRTAVQ
jgi:prepilin-type N-terminal cleavage/methylation domain-containing protein